MPAAIAIPLIMGATSAATTIYATKKQADASKQASDVQVNASNQAMQYQQQQQQRAMQYAEQMRTQPLQGPQPGGAQSYLSSLMHIPGAGSFGAPPLAPSNQYQMQPPKTGFAPDPNGSTVGIPRGPSMGMQPYQGLLGGPSAGPVGGQAGQAASGGLGSPGGMVMLQAPTGEQRSVPADQAPGLIARGARRVG